MQRWELGSERLAGARVQSGTPAPIRSTTMARLEGSTSNTGGLRFS